MFLKDYMFLCISGKSTNPTHAIKSLWDKEWVVQYSKLLELHNFVKLIEELFVKSGNCIWRFMFFWPPVQPVLNVIPPFVRLGEMFCNFVPTSATLAGSTKPARRGAVRGSLLFLLFTTLSPISIYISGLIIRPDMSLVWIAPGNASTWHPRLAVSQGHCKQGEKKRVCLCICLSVVTKKKRKTCVGFVLIPVQHAWAWNFTVWCIFKAHFFFSLFIAM